MKMMLVEFRGQLNLVVAIGKLNYLRFFATILANLDFRKQISNLDPKIEFKRAFSV